MFYSINEGNSNNTFAINSTSGVVISAKQLDYENISSYTLVIVVSDRISSASDLISSSTTTVRIIVENVDEESPVVSSGYFSINENAVLGSIVGEITLSDDFGITTVRVVSGNQSGTFEVSTTGLLTVTGSLNYEIQSSYVLTIEAEDSIGKNGTNTVVIDVINIEELGSVVIVGISKEDELLSSKLEDDDGVREFTEIYKWKKDGVEIEASNSSVYRTNQSDVGKIITVEVVYKDFASNATKKVVSTATDEIENVNDIGLVWISGNSTEDETLTAELTDEDGYFKHKRYV